MVQVVLQDFQEHQDQVVQVELPVLQELVVLRVLQELVVIQDLQEHQDQVVQVELQEVAEHQEVAD